MARTELVILLVLLVGSVSFTSVYAIELTGLRTIINTFDATPGAHWFKTGAAEPGSLFMNILGSTDSAAFAVQIAPGGNLGLHVGSDGNVGVGTGSPAQKLDVNGNIKLNGDILSDTDICIGTCP